MERAFRSVPFSCLLLRVLSSLGGRGSKLPAGSRGMATASRFQDGTSPGRRGGFHRMSMSRRGEFRGRQQQPAGYDNDGEFNVKARRSKGTEARRDFSVQKHVAMHV